MLVVAASLGFSFSADIVECILESNDFLQSMPNFLKDKFWPLPMSKADTQQAMANAACAGLIDVLPDKKFKFSHDRVQQSVLSTLNEGEERQVCSECSWYNTFRDETNEKIPKIGCSLPRSIYSWTATKHRQ